MSKELWTSVDTYLEAHALEPDPILDAALQSAAGAGLPPISVTPSQGKFLNLVARILGARRVLELGTLAGYSTIWLARALPKGGRIITVEFDTKHAAVARANLERAGVAHLVDLRESDALAALEDISREGLEPFDLVFIDADKQRIPQYFDAAVRLSRRGGVIIVDNVVRDGAVVDPDNTDPNVVGVRRFFDALASDPRVDATTIQTVGAKGYDGFTMALVRGHALHEA